MHLLVPFVNLYNHPDPLFEEYTYGESRARAIKLKKNVKKGDFVFFHTSKRGQKYITAYYIADRVLDTAVAIKDMNIDSKYNNPHMSEMKTGRISKNSDNVILFGDPILSRVLDRPLPFDMNLAKKLSLNIKFPTDRTETQAIGSATRNWRELTDKDVKILQKEIWKLDKKGLPTKKLLSSEEVSNIVEKHLEDIISDNPRLIDKSMKLEKRQLVTDDGRIDLLLEDADGNKIIVEMKLHKIGRGAVEQTRNYMKWLKKKTNKKVSGIIVCEGVMPAFAEDIKKLKDIKVLCYGWQLQTQQWNES
jgi:hypothetical protein